MACTDEWWSPEQARRYIPTGLISSGIAQSGGARCGAGCSRSATDLHSVRGVLPDLRISPGSGWGGRARLRRARRRPCPPGWGECGIRRRTGGRRAPVRGPASAAGAAGGLPDPFAGHTQTARAVCYDGFMGLRRDLSGLLPGGGLAWQRRTPGLRHSRPPGVRPHTGVRPCTGVHPCTGVFPCTVVHLCTVVHPCTVVHSGARQGRVSGASGCSGADRCRRRPGPGRWRTSVPCPPCPCRGWWRCCSCHRPVAGTRLRSSPVSWACRARRSVRPQERTTPRSDGAPRWSNRNARCVRARR